MRAYFCLNGLHCYLIVRGIKNKPDGAGNCPIRYKSVFGAQPLLGPLSKACCYGAGNMCTRRQHTLNYILVQARALPHSFAHNKLSCALFSSAVMLLMVYSSAILFHLQTKLPSRTRNLLRVKNLKD